MPDKVVLKELRRAAAMARGHARAFAEYPGGKQSAEILVKEAAVQKPQDTVPGTGAPRPGGPKKSCWPSKFITMILAASEGVRGTKKAPGRNSLRNSCRGASPNPGCACQGEAKIPFPSFPKPGALTPSRRPSGPPPGRSSPRPRPGPPGPCGRMRPACGKWACGGPGPG